MLNSKTKQSAFFSLFICAVLALSLTSCKKNNEKQDEVHQENTAIQQNTVNKNNQPLKNKQEVIEKEQVQKVDNEYPVSHTELRFDYQDDARFIVLLLDYCINTKSIEVCEKIADIYNGGIVNGKIKIANNAKAQIKQQLNIDLDNELKTFEEQMKNIENLNEKIKEIDGNIRKLENNRNLDWKEVNKARDYLNNERRNISSEIGKIKQKYRKSIPYTDYIKGSSLESQRKRAINFSNSKNKTANREWEQYETMLAEYKSHFEYKVKETIYELYEIACYNESNIKQGSTSACYKAALSSEEVNRSRGADTIYGDVCKNKNISDFCVMAGDTLLHITPAQMQKDSEYIEPKTKEERKEMRKKGKIIRIDDIRSDSAASYYGLAEKTPEVEEKLALAEQINKYNKNVRKECMRNRPDNARNWEISLLVKDITDQREKMNRLWEIAKSDTCIIKKDGQLILVDRTKFLEEQQQQKDEFLQSIGVPTN